MDHPRGDKELLPKARQGAGRPPKEIDWALFEELCHIQCTQSEIASVLKINVDTLHDRAKAYYQKENYSDIYKKFSEDGKSSLRRNQYKMSATNCSMAIWLGKQWLGQVDTPLQNQIDENSIKQFAALMNQLSSLQSDKKSASTSISSDNKS